MLLAVLAVRIVSRRRLLRIFQVPGLIIMPLVFVFAPDEPFSALKWGIFTYGLCTISQMSFWGNYMPKVFPTHLRGTGESFAANIGGRMIGTCAALLTTTLAASMPGDTPTHRMAYAAASVALGTYLVGFIASFYLPEPKLEKLPD
jgi:hypothetical protein